MNEPYLTPDQVAELLSVSTRTVLRMVARNADLPVLRISGQTLRFPRERLLRWLQQREGGRSAGRSAHRSAHGGVDRLGGGAAG